MRMAFDLQNYILEKKRFSTEKKYWIAHLSHSPKERFHLPLIPTHFHTSFRDTASRRTSLQQHGAEDDTGSIGKVESDDCDERGEQEICKAVMGTKEFWSIGTNEKC